MHILNEALVQSSHNWIYTSEATRIPFEVFDTSVAGELLTYSGTWEDTNLAGVMWRNA